MINGESDMHRIPCTERDVVMQPDDGKGLINWTCNYRGINVKPGWKEKTGIFQIASCNYSNIHVYMVGKIRLLPGIWTGWIE